MAENNTTATRKLTAFFKGKGDVDLEFEEKVEEGDADQSEFQATLNCMALFLAKIKLILIVLALLTFIGLFITVIVLSSQNTAMKEELKEIGVTGKWLFFFSKETELKAPFEDRLLETFRAPEGTGIRMKLNEKCLGKASISGTHFVPNDESICSTSFRCPVNNNTMDIIRGPGVEESECVFCDGPNCLLYVSKCYWDAIFFPENTLMNNPVAPRVTAVDLQTGRLYFVIYNLNFPLQCVGKCDQMIMLVLTMQFTLFS